MSVRTRILRAALVLAVLGGGAYAYYALRGPGDPGFHQGYVEGESIRIGAPVAGTLAVLAVRRGQTVRAGDPLFELDRTTETAARDEAAAALRFAEAQFKRQQELIGPINKKAYDAIQAVAKENSYVFVFEKEALLVAPPAEDILPLVAKKLNIKLPPAGSQPANKPATTGGTKQ